MGTTGRRRAGLGGNGGGPPLPAAPPPGLVRVNDVWYSANVSDATLRGLNKLGGCNGCWCDLQSFKWIENDSIKNYRVKTLNFCSFGDCHGKNQTSQKER